MTRWPVEKGPDIQAYVASRVPHSTFEVVRFGVTKTDFDLRDTLGLLTPAPGISALLD